MDATISPGVAAPTTQNIGESSRDGCAKLWSSSSQSADTSLSRPVAQS